METIYYTTKKRYIRPKKIVDLMEYKRSLEQMERCLPALPEPAGERAVILPLEPSEPHPQTLLGKVGQVLDMVASLALTLCALAAIFLLM